ILRFTAAVNFAGGMSERREIERRQAVAGGERIDGEEALWRPVKARRMLGGGAAGKVHRHRSGCRWWRPEGPEAIEDAARCDRFARCLGFLRSGFGDVLGAG